VKIDAPNASSVCDVLTRAALSILLGNEREAAVSCGFTLINQNEVRQVMGRSFSAHEAHVWSQAAQAHLHTLYRKGL